MGADTPHVELTVLLESFRLLDDNDVVVGPATDGGYYLLGLRSGWDLSHRQRISTPLPTCTNSFQEPTTYCVVPGDLPRHPRIRTVDLNAGDSFGDAE
jgi:hypothetical protein